jgi:hypothetical protein
LNYVSNPLGIDNSIRQGTLSGTRTLSSEECILLAEVVERMRKLIDNSREQDHNLYKELGI